jgi:predicted O-methyltransferase YrrM
MGLGQLVAKASRSMRDEGLHATLAKARHRLGFFRDIVIASRRLRSELRGRNLGPQEALDLAFDFSVGEVSIVPAQVRSEIEGLCDALRAEPPQNIIELGTARGGTLFLLTRAARPDARLATVDLPDGEFGSGYERARSPLLKSLPLPDQKLKLVLGDSHLSTTRDLLAEWFAPEPVDLLFIDGDHLLEGVRSDFEMYGPLVRAGGFIAFHDIVPGSPDRVGGVPEFWAAIKNLYEHREFVEDWDQGGFGIGVVRVPPLGIATKLSELRSALAHRSPSVR